MPTREDCNFSAPNSSTVFRYPESGRSREPLIQKLLHPPDSGCTVDTFNLQIERPKEPPSNGDLRID